MNRSKSKPPSWCVARVLGLLPGLALAGFIAGCSESVQHVDPAAPQSSGGPATTSANPTPEQVTNANPSSPSVPPADGTNPTTEGGPATQGTGTETPPASKSGDASKGDAPKVIEKPAEPTPSDKGAEPK